MSSNPQIITLPNTLDSTPFADICNGLKKPIGERTLPTILLYDERGLRLYDDITTKAPEYYLFAAEEQILRDNGSSIVRLMHGGSPVRNGEVVLELGAGYVFQFYGFPTPTVWSTEHFARHLYSSKRSHKLHPF
jgi:L-histidine Nalpha-methyltransferase / hercynylcysteine S-oxide synthase